MNDGRAQCFAVFFKSSLVDQIVLMCIENIFSFDTMDVLLCKKGPLENVDSEGAV